MVLNGAMQLVNKIKLTKESCCLRLFYTVVIFTEFFSYLVRNQDIKKSKVYLQEPLPTKRKGSFLLDLAYYVTKKTFHNTPV